MCAAALLVPPEAKGVIGGGKTENITTEIATRTTEVAESCWNRGEEFSGGQRPEGRFIGRIRVVAQKYSVCWERGNAALTSRPTATCAVSCCSSG
jgi:hypothetical protein